MRASKSFAAVLASFGALAVFSVSGSAAANPNYPGYLKTQLGLTYTPTCKICHTTDPGLGSNANQDFALLLQKNYQLNADEPEQAFDAIITKDQTAKGDADGDGTPDIDELIGKTPQGYPTSPSDSSTVRIDVAAPAYGCFNTGDTGGGGSASISGRSNVPLVGAAITVFGLALAMRRRKKR